MAFTTLGDAAAIADIAADVTDIAADVSSVLSRVSNTVGLQSEIFLTSGTWVKPSGVSVVDVALCGGGGGGGGGRDSTCAPCYTYVGGRGGGGGGVAQLTNMPVTGDLVVTIGAGGAGGLGIDDSLTNLYNGWSHGYHGSPGGTTSCGILSATGGLGGPGGGPSYTWAGSGGSPAGGNGGLVSPSISDARGGDMCSATFSVYKGAGGAPNYAGGGGGGAFSSNVSGATGQGTAFRSAGAGGGVGYGGGGGGGAESSGGVVAGTGGAGAPGYCIITWWA